MSDDEHILQNWYAYFGLSPHSTLEELTAAFEARRAQVHTDEDRQTLQAGYDYLRIRLEALPPNAVLPQGVTTEAASPAELTEDELARKIARKISEDARKREPFTKKDHLVNLIAFPAIILLGWLISKSSVMSIFIGFKIWSHEFGHATVAWFSGYRALPLPIGWTNIELDKTMVVYVCLAFLIGAFMWSGWKEGKTWPIVLGGILLIIQNGMTWLLSDERFDVWTSFAGIGGEFYLNALCMAAFFFRLPKKFRWKTCRFVMLFLCAISFTGSVEMWYEIEYKGEAIPFGSLIHGPDDQGGDMNGLMHAGWSMKDISRAYNKLSMGCIVMLLGVYAGANIHNWILLRSQQRKDENEV